MAVDGNSIADESTRRQWSYNPPTDGSRSDPTELGFGYSQSGVDSTSTYNTAARQERLPFGSIYSDDSAPPQAQSVAVSESRSISSILSSWSSYDTVLAQLIASGRGIFGDSVTPLRLAGHLSVLFIAALILTISRMDIPSWDVTIRILPEGVHSVTKMNREGGAVSAQVGSYNTARLGSQTSLQRSAIPFTLVQVEPSKEIQYYTVQPGDTVLGIAEKYGIDPETIIWSNSGLDKHVELIRAGDSLAILPINGAYHEVVAGDTLSSLADEYDVTMDAIVGYLPNGLQDNAGPLTVGQQLVIPGGSKPFQEQFVTAYNGPVPASAPIGSGDFVWPASGPITQRFWSAHPGMDIGGWANAPVKAADSGYVTLAANGWNTGYGNYVVIDHGNGFSSLYAHLNSIYVYPGESVARGQAIGGLGNTGNSTGPHLHFEIRYQNVPYNPLGYLP